MKVWGERCRQSSGRTKGRRGSEEERAGCHQGTKELDAWSEVGEGGKVVQGDSERWAASKPHEVSQASVKGLNFIPGTIEELFAEFLVEEKYNLTCILEEYTSWYMVNGEYLMEEWNDGFNSS